MEKLVRSFLLVALIVSLASSFGGNYKMVMGKGTCFESWAAQCDVNGVAECVPQCQLNHGASLINSYCETIGNNVTCNCAYKC
ncbi:hypothetical protein CASFOL_016509 [Castilleja foliolosa]|uniref:Uncharacterized protein n=1 Tax=Castilleja foliolosa TaxID=1961234 RepID=A0ABD3DA87_9LAMI